MKKNNDNAAFTYIDLFAGLGGFHLAMQKLGGKCVFASELQEDLRQIYTRNYGIECAGDITKVDYEKDIPPHDVLCGGFPCQPFSKAGKQQGFNDEKDRGNMFLRIMEIIEIHKPKYIFLENVPNLKSHDNGNTYNVITEKLKKYYDIDDDIISPHQFGIPQHRTRFYLVGKLKNSPEDTPLDYFSFPKHDKKIDCDINKILIPEDDDYMSLKDITRTHLSVWQEFLDILTKNKVKVPSFPIWTMEFGATYEYEKTAPFYQQIRTLEGKLGKFGTPIYGNSKDDMLQLLPIYAQTDKTEENHQFPEWKKNFIKWNREFYLKNKKILDPWLEKVRQPGFENSHQKFEWNCGEEENPNLYKKIIQFRPSGIRVKNPTYSPALVLTTTQIPIIPWIKTPKGEIGRYMTRKEAAKLQCMEGIECPDTIAKAFRAFGNAVNVEVVYRIGKALLEVKDDQ